MDTMRLGPDPCEIAAHTGENGGGGAGVPVADKPSPNPSHKWEGDRMALTPPSRLREGPGEDLSDPPGFPYSSRLPVPAAGLLAAGLRPFFGLLALGAAGVSSKASLSSFTLTCTSPPTDSLPNSNS